MLHITNGDAVARKLEEAGVGGEVSISADLLHEGPCPTAAGASDMMTAFRSTQEMEERGTWENRGFGPGGVRAFGERLPTSL